MAVHIVPQKTISRANANNLTPSDHLSMRQSHTVLDNNMQHAQMDNEWIHFQSRYIHEFKKKLQHENVIALSGCNHGRI